MPSGYYFAARKDTQAYLNENPMWRWWIVPTDDADLEFLVCHFLTEEDKNRWEEWPGVEKIERPRGSRNRKITAAHRNRLKLYGVEDGDDIWKVSDKVAAKVGKMMRLPDF